MEWFFVLGWSVHRNDFHHPDVLEWGLKAARSPRSRELHSQTSNFHLGCAGGLPGTGAQFHRACAQKGRCVRRLSQVLGLPTEAAVVATADHKVDPVYLTNV